MRHLSFTLPAGEVLALVGENGAGKTTIVKLLTRLYDPSEGRVLLGGHDIRDYDVDAVRAGIGVIFQDFVRYDLTAAENIAVGRIGAREDRPMIERAAERGRADEVIARLPGGYDQPVGRKFRGGMDLSGGEWQKIAIARAYMRDARMPDFGRADGGARCAGGIRGVPAVQGAECRPHLGADLAPVLERAHGRPHPSNR